jgi:hypothetical protein
MRHEKQSSPKIIEELKKKFGDESVRDILGLVTIPRGSWLFYLIQ